MNNRQVVRRWLNGEPGRSGNGNLHTDGKKLYSYKLIIGETDGVEKIVHHYHRGGDCGFISQTTSCHVGLALGEKARWKC